MGNKMIILKREISYSDLELINKLISTEGQKGRTHISKRLCQIWNWLTPNGQYRDIACRDLLRRLDRKGLISLPPMLRPARKPGYVNSTFLPSDFDKTPIQCSLSNFSSIEAKMVRGSSNEKLYNGIIGSYHYLGYHQGNGEQLKYIIKGDDRILSCIGFGCAAYKIADRDKFIGWDRDIREFNLSKIVNNNRFLILPWVQVKNLASFILGMICRRIRQDWSNYYNREIVLVETFVEKERFKGTSYKAANWINIGQTTGRGRNDRYSKNKVPIKDIYVYPLIKGFKKACNVLRQSIGVRIHR